LAPQTLKIMFFHHASLCGSRLRTTSVLFALELCGFASGCSRDVSHEGDAAVSTDALTDADVAAMDGREVDAPYVPDDVGPAIVDDAGWATPRWLPPYTNVQFATDPARMIEPLVWVPCRDGRDGCRELQRDGCGDPYPGLGQFATQTNHGRKNWLSVTWTTIDPTRRRDERIVAMTELDGPTAMAWKCTSAPWELPDGLTYPRVVDDIPYSFIRFKSTRNRNDRDRLAILQGFPTTAPGRPANLRIVDNYHDLRGASERYFDLSTTTAIFSSEQAVAYIPLRPDLPVRVFHDPSNAFAFELVQVHGDTAFWEANIRTNGEDYRSEEWTVRGNEAPRRLLAPPGGVLNAFDTDGTTMAWVVGYDLVPARSHFARSRLYMAPYTSNPDKLQPRLVLSFGASNLDGGHAMQNGFYATGNFLGPFYVVDLRDGSYWEINSQPGGMRLLRPIFISDTEVGFESWLPMHDCFTVVRLRMDTLGARHAPQDPT
jgi:hypothetical protein